MSDWVVPLVASVSGAVVGSGFGGWVTSRVASRTMDRTEDRAAVTAVDAVVARVQATSVRAHLMMGGAEAVSRWSAEKAGFNEQMAVAWADFAGALIEAQARTVERWPGMAAELERIGALADSVRLSLWQRSKPTHDVALQATTASSAWLRDHDIFEAPRS